MTIWKTSARTTIFAIFCCIIQNPAFSCTAHITLLGGTVGLASLEDKKASAQYRLLSCSGFYLHYSATDPAMFSRIMPAVAKVFNGKPVTVEVALGGGFNPSFWTTLWKTQVVAYGWAPQSAFIDISLADSNSLAATSFETLRDFNRFIDAGRKEAALERFSPLFSPNMSGGASAEGDGKTTAVAHPWVDAWWQPVREMAEIGGGIALDSPPAFFLHGLPTPKQQLAYRQFEADVLRWAAAKKLPATMVISPYFDGGRFREDSQSMQQMLLAAGAVPSVWAIVNYNECNDPYPKRCTPEDAAFLTPIGTETDQESVAGVALWFARHAKIRP